VFYDTRLVADALTEILRLTRLYLHEEEIGDRPELPSSSVAA
jgi:hypothetical protein